MRHSSFLLITTRGYGVQICILFHGSDGMYVSPIKSLVSIFKQQRNHEWLVNEFYGLKSTIGLDPDIMTCFEESNGFTDDYQNMGQRFRLS